LHLYEEYDEYNDTVFIVREYVFTFFQHRKIAIFYVFEVSCQKNVKT